jgi:hypothetical protein
MAWLPGTKNEVGGVNGRSQLTNTEEILIGADRDFHGPFADGQVVDPIRFGASVKIFTELTTMGAKAHGGLRDDSETRGSSAVVRSSSTT